MSCEIFIDTPGPFYSGNPIQGRVVCNFHERFKIRAIKIRVFGDEHAEWMGSETYYNEAEKRQESRSVLLTGDNNLFSLENILYGGHGGDLHMGPGQFTYPFNVQIPKDIPSTFENSYGYIRYSLKAIVDIPWAVDIEDLVHFQLLSLIDLNTFPAESFQPVSRSDEKTICCWCCAGGEISININLAKCAFVPGEKVKLFVSLTNMSNVNVDSLETKLKKYTKTHVNTPQHESRTDEEVLAVNAWSGVGAHSENKYDIEIPISKDIFVPNLKHSSLFDVTYDVEINANIPGCHEDINMGFVVYMGHIQHQSQMPPGYQSEVNAYPQTNIVNPYHGQVASPPYLAGPLPSAPGAAPFPSNPPAPYPTGPPAPYPPSQYPPAAPQTPYAGFVVPGATAPSEPAPFPGGMYPAISGDKPPIYEGGNPSAPNVEAPPPSYRDVTKKS